MNGNDNVKVTVEVEVNPTEDVDNVRVAVRMVMGDLQLEVIDEDDYQRLIGKAEGSEALSTFHEMLRRELILDAARKVLFKSMNGNRVTFYLNKQVAYAGHISFSQAEGESPLGPIKVEIECERPQELIEWLAPRTPRKKKRLER